MNDLIVPKDLYIIPSEEDENYILYRPSKHLLALVEPQMASNIAAILKETDAHTKSKPYDVKYSSLLLEKGFLDSDMKISEVNNSAQPIRQPFSPHELTLDITKKCNMRCTYCYSNAGESSISMSEECGYKAIDFCVLNAKPKGCSFGLHFHGGGEPSQEFELLAKFYNYAQAKCKNENINFKCSVITNGLISTKVTDFYIRYMDEITVSIDGDEISHDEQRPSVNGGPTFNKVYTTCKYLLKHGKKFNIRTTITSKNVHRLEEIVGFYIKEFPVPGGSINIEPITLVGRALGKEHLACDPNIFAKNLFKSLKMGINSNVNVFYSGVSGHSQRKEFCAASAPSFSVCADGTVTSCFAYSNKDVVRDLFIYGRFDEKTNKFVFDNDKILKLQTLTMDHDPYCKDCFCKTHCIGDCPAIRKFELTDCYELIEKLDMDFMKNRRCASNRRVVTLLLEDMVRGRLNISPLPRQCKCD
ncbi:MAG: radical SAM protein [Planctomycetota bacterium]